ncbi:MAG: DUF2344 domain-containing protein [Clostridia bacterium]|nr:DUF2344 domain-containing protein [Clostridia bacterium]
MSKYILKYTRDERVKYVSHLDFIRLFHRAVRRSGVDFLFSEGFNPHPVMTVAMPLSVGVTSGGEYMKVGFTDSFTEEEIKNRINCALPPGYHIESVYRLKGKEIDLTKINKADYTVMAELKKGAAPCDIDRVLASDSLVVMKKTKSGTKPSDIRPYIYALDEEQYADGVVTYKMRLACGNDYNLKPETVISAMEETDSGFRTSFLCIHRDRLILPGEE